jgi:AcrR family transcriptional regulator
MEMATGRRPTSAPARERLIAAADDLFSRDGIAATPVDEAIRRAGVATATLYHHFDGKDALVAAYLRHRHERWMRRWERHVAAAADPADALLAIFDALDAWEREGGAARGCAFVDAAAELSDRGHPAWIEITAHKEGVRARLVELAADAGHADADGLADRLVLLYEGALSALLVGYVDRPIALARAVAETLVRAARPPS